MDGEEEEENDVLLSGVGKKVFWNGAAEKKEREKVEAAPRLSWANLESREYY